MGLLDANVAQLVSSSAGFGDQAALMRSTIQQAESSAMAAQGFHQGESSIAFQQAHARFVEASAKANALLDVAGANINEGASVYSAQDSAGASDITAAAGSLPTSM
ncbi:WXG100 family type VII secretion target [Mycolicibacterium fortuitum]|uniref:WXG100 family type VII secretion target n=1 Tax=Mycolicibacterium fortuitum TaxID=1766 RepID=UPI003AAAD077